MNQTVPASFACILLLAGCTPPPGPAIPTDFGKAMHGLAELLKGPPIPPPPFVIVGTTYFFEPEFCRYFVIAPPIPAGKRGHVTIEDNERPTGVIEVFVAPLDWDPTTTAGRPPRSPRTTMNGNGTTSAVGPGILTLHLANDRPPPRVRVDIGP